MRFSAEKLAAYVLRKVAVMGDPFVPPVNNPGARLTAAAPALPTREQLWGPRFAQQPAAAPASQAAPAAAPAPQAVAAKTAPKAAPVGGKGVTNLNAPQNKAQAAKYSPALIQKWNQQYAAKHQALGGAKAAPAAQGSSQGMAWLDPYLRQAPAAGAVAKTAPKAAPARPAPRSITTPAQDEGVIAKYLSTPAAAPRQVRDTEIARRASPPGKGRGITG
jgi:hypothetical protein